MAMGLASMNAMPGARIGVVMVQDKPDKDLTQGWGSYSVTSDFDSDHVLGIDPNGKLATRKSKELNEHSVAVYQVRNLAANLIMAKLLREAQMDYDQRPVHNPSYIYEVFTGNKVLCEDQADYDPLLERVYLDKISKKMNGIVDSFDGDISTIFKGRIDAHYPLEERPYGASSEEDGSVKFPMLASSIPDIEEMESVLESIMTGKDEVDVETDEP